jgi:hypothetical protein
MRAVDEYKARNAAREARHAENKNLQKKEPWWFKQPLPIDRFTGWLMVFTGLLFLATVVSAAILIKTDFTLGDQAEAIRGQLKEMKNQRLLTIAQSRATIARVEMVHIPIGENDELIVPGQKIYGWQIGPVWKNVGATDAIDFIGWWNIDVRPFPLRDANGNARVECPIPMRPSILPSPLIISRDQISPAVQKKLSFEDAKDAVGQNAIKIIYINGHLEYDDVFPDTKHHRLDWCVQAYPSDLQRNVFSFPRFKEETEK